METKADKWHSEVKGYLDAIRVKNLPREEEQQLMFYVQKQLERKEDQSIYHPHQFSDELSLNSLNATRIADKTNLMIEDDTTNSLEISQAKQNLSNKENELPPPQESVQPIKNTLPKPLKRVSFSSTINSAYPTSDHRNSLEKIQSENEVSSFKVPSKSPQKSVLSPKRNSTLLSPKAIINSPNRSAQIVKKSLEKSDAPLRTSNLSPRSSPHKEKIQNLSNTLGSPKNQSFGSPNKTHQMSTKSIFSSPKLSPIQSKLPISSMSNKSPSRSAKMISKSLKQSFNSALSNKTEESVNEMSDLNLQENEIFKPTKTLNRSLPLNNPVEEPKPLKKLEVIEQKSEQPVVPPFTEQKSIDKPKSLKNTPKKPKLSEQRVNTLKNANESPERKKPQVSPRNFLSPKNSPLLKKIADKKMTEAFLKPNNSAFEEPNQNNASNGSLNSSVRSCVTRSAAKNMDIEVSIKDPSPFKDAKMNAAYKSLFTKGRYRSLSVANLKNKPLAPNHSSPVRPKKVPSKSEAVLPKESSPLPKTTLPIHILDQNLNASEQSADVTCGFANSKNYSEVTIEPLEATTGFAIQENLVVNSFKDMTCGFVIYDPPHVSHPGVNVKKLPTYIDMGINVNMSADNISEPDKPDVNAENDQEIKQSVPINNEQPPDVSIAQEPLLNVSAKQISVTSSGTARFKEPQKIAEKIHQTPPDIEYEALNEMDELEFDDQKAHEETVVNENMNKSNIFSFTPSKSRNLGMNKSLLEESFNTQIKNFHIEYFKTKNSFFEVLNENSNLIKLTIEPRKKLKVNGSKKFFFKKIIFEVESGKLEFGNAFGPQYTATKGDIVDIDLPERYYIKNLYKRKGVLICKSFPHNQ